MQALRIRISGDNLGGPEVGQVVLPATPGGSPAAREWQVNVPLTRNNDLPYGFGAPADSVTDPAPRGWSRSAAQQHRAYQKAISLLLS